MFGVQTMRVYVFVCMKEKKETRFATVRCFSSAPFYGD